jgi:hypothetical protein
VLIVSRNDNAEYRVRGYLSAQADGKVAWVLDVFDSGRRRTMRLSGEEPAAVGEGWSGPSDAVVAKIASQSIAELSQWLASAQQAPTLVASRPTGQTDQPAPDTSGGDDTPDVAALGAGHGAPGYAPY